MPLVGGEHDLEDRPLFTEFLADLLFERTAGREFDPKRVTDPIQERELPFQVEGEVIQEQIHAHHRQPPARVQAFVAGDPIDDTDCGLAVDMEDPLGEQHPRGSAVPLHLAVIGVELQSIDRAFLAMGLDRPAEIAEHLAEQAIGVAVEADAYMPVRIPIADEVPVIRRPGLHGSLRHRKDHLAQDAVRG